MLGVALLQPTTGTLLDTDSKCQALEHRSRRSAVRSPRPRASLQDSAAQRSKV